MAPSPLIPRASHGLNFQALQNQVEPISKQETFKWNTQALGSIEQDSLTWKHLRQSSPQSIVTASAFEENPLGLNIQYPSTVAPTHFGFKLIASEDIPALTAVERFGGPLVSYSDPETTDYDRRYVLNLFDMKQFLKIQADQHQFPPHKLDQDGWVWLLPLTNARYCNHSCVPNCVITDDLFIITITPVKKNEELTFLYNKSEEGNVVPYGMESSKWYWDPLWSFNCACQSQHCQGTIDRYRNVNEFAHQQISKEIQEKVQQLIKSGDKM